MKAGPSPATLDAFERVIPAGERLTAAEVAERAGTNTRHAREVLAILARQGRVEIIDDGEIGRLHARIERDLNVPAPEPEETITAGRHTIRTRDPQMKAVLRDLSVAERALALVKRKPPRVAGGSRDRRMIRLVLSLRPETFERIRSMAVRDAMGVSTKIRELLDKRSRE